MSARGLGVLADPDGPPHA